MPDQNSEDPSCSIKRHGPRRGVFRHYLHLDMALWVRKLLQATEWLCAAFISPPDSGTKMMILVVPHRFFCRCYFSRN